MRRIRELNRSRWALAVLAAGVFALMLALNILTPYICDDYTYRLNFQTREPLASLWEIIPSMAAHSVKMNGRLISHGLAQMFMLLPPVVFDVVNAAVFTLTLYLAHRLCAGERNGLLFSALFCLTWLLMPVFGQVVLWQVGALNYFWSLTGLLLFITPSLLRLQEEREVLKRQWQRAAFCVYGFFFGWYSEIASFVGICLVICLVLLDALLNKHRLRFSRLLPVLTAAVGYVTLLLMPAQRANKQSDFLTMEILLQRAEECAQVLADRLMIPLVLFALLLAFALRFRLSKRTLWTAILFALAGFCANFMPIAASYYPERCMCTSVFLLLMGSGILAAHLGHRKRFPAYCVVCCLIFLLTLPFGLRGSRDILSCHRQNAQREQTIAAALEDGVTEVTANAVVPQTQWSGFYGLRDLTNDPTTWPNHAMALYYGLDSLTAE